MKTSNKNCRQLVADRTPFKAHHLFAEIVNGFYVVYSYGHHWPLWACDPQGYWYENVDKYSPSTSRQKSHTRPFALDFFKCGTLQLKDIINGGVYGIPQTLQETLQ